MLPLLNLPIALTTRSGAFMLRDANRTDVEAVIFLLSGDPISAARGDVGSAADGTLYLAALERIITDPANALLVVEDKADNVVGTMQLTLIPGMARRGSTRLLVEAVRVHSAHRSQDIGGSMMRWLTDTAARELGAQMVQLTSDASRIDAHRFYERLGFTGSHIGYKYKVHELP